MISPLCRSWSATSREVTFVTLVYFMYQLLTFSLNNILYYLPLFSNLPTSWLLCRHLASWKWASFWLDLMQVPVKLLLPQCQCHWAWLTHHNQCPPPGCPGLGYHTWLVSACGFKVALAKPSVSILILLDKYQSQKFPCLLNLSQHFLLNCR